MKLKINAHARDGFWVNIDGWENNGYLPDFIADALGYERNGGDDLDLEIDTETGQILNWVPSRFHFEIPFETRLQNALQNEYYNEVFGNSTGISLNELLIPENFEAIRMFLEINHVRIDDKMKIWKCFRDKITENEKEELLTEILNIHGSFNSCGIEFACKPFIEMLTEWVQEFNDGKLPDDFFKQFCEFYFDVVRHKGSVNTYYVYKRYPKILKSIYKAFPMMNINIGVKWISGDKSLPFFEHYIEVIVHDRLFNSEIPNFDSFLLSYDEDNEIALKKIETMVNNHIKLPENAFQRFIDHYYKVEHELHLQWGFEYVKLIPHLVKKLGMKTDKEYIENLYNKRKQQYEKYFEENYKTSGQSIIEKKMKTSFEAHVLKII